MIVALCPASPLEQKLHAELHHSGAADGVCDLPEIGSGVAHHVFRCPEVYAVEKIENLPAKIDAHSFADRGLLGKRHVETLLAGRAEYVAAQVAEAAVVGIAASRRHRGAQDALVE